MEQHLKLIGLNKKEIISEMGEGYNFYPDNVWTYDIKRNFIGMRTVLIIFFWNEVAFYVEKKRKFN